MKQLLAVFVIWFLIFSIGTGVGEGLKSKSCDSEYALAYVNVIYGLSCEITMGLRRRK